MMSRSMNDVTIELWGWSRLYCDQCPQRSVNTSSRGRLLLVPGVGPHGTLIYPNESSTLLMTIGGTARSPSTSSTPTVFERRERHELVSDVVDISDTKTPARRCHKAVKSLRSGTLYRPMPIPVEPLAALPKYPLAWGQGISIPS